MSNFDAMELAEKLKKLRKERRISQQEIAEACDVSQGLVSLWEKGQNVPSLLHGAAMADIFGVSVDYLARERDERSIRDAEIEVRVREFAAELGWDGLYRSLVAGMKKPPAAPEEQPGAYTPIPIPLHPDRQAGRISPARDPKTGDILKPEGGRRKKSS